MIDEFQPLNSRFLPVGTLLTRADRENSKPVTLDTGALSVMTDFNHVRPFFVTTTATINEINQKMIACGVRLLFVSENNNALLLGLVTYNDLFGNKPVRYLQEHGGRHDGVLAGDIMTPLSALEALSLSDVSKARVGDIVSTIESSGRQHVLVVEEFKDGARVISGLFSSTDLEKRLDIKIEITSRANTFADLERALSG
jgi:CBS domain-containing protein